MTWTTDSCQRNSLKVLKVPSKNPSMTAFVSTYSRDQVRYALYNPDKGTVCPFNRDLGVWRNTVFTTYAAAILCFTALFGTLL